MITRKLEPIIAGLLKEFRVIYLTGPRQAGKTTIVRNIAESMNMAYVTLDDSNILASVSNDPQGFIQSLGDQTLVLDEFQYAPNLIPAIKECSDKLPPDQKGKFLLTGSADIFRSAKTQEALPGHMVRLELYPLSVAEITGSISGNAVDYLFKDPFPAQDFTFIDRKKLATYLLNGGYPEVQEKSQRAKTLWFNSYIEGRLYKDFESLYAARGDYHSKLQALVPYLSGLSGNLLKYANVANDLDLDDKLVKTYIEILELMFIIKRVPAYVKNPAKRQASRMPKLHFIDSGLACHLLGFRGEAQFTNHAIFGGLLESFIYTELVKQSAWSLDDIAFYHFRDNKKNEVDLVLEQNSTSIIGLEIKASATVSARDFSGLVKFADYVGKKFKRGFLFYSGEKLLPFHQQGHEFYALPIALLFSGAE